MPRTIQCFCFFPFHIIILFLLFINANYSFSAAVNEKNNETSRGQNQYSLVHVGLVLHLDSRMGSMVDLCINMALSDFYSEHTNYQTRLQLHTKDAKSLLEANFAGIFLIPMINFIIYKLSWYKDHCGSSFIFQKVRKINKVQKK